VARKPADQSVNRDTILAAAADVLARRGYDTATMKEIAAAVNLTAASLYHHFRSKDALVLSVLEMGLDAAIARIEPIACDTARSPAERLRAMIAAHIAAIADQPAVGAAMVFEIRDLRHMRPPTPDADADDHAAFTDFAARRDRFFARRDAFEGLFRAIVAEGVACAVFRPVDVPIFVKALLGANNWVGVWYRPDGRLNGAAIAALNADYFLAALALRS
jgi:AcrR family transcriptional regulator